MQPEVRDAAEEIREAVSRGLRGHVWDALAAIPPEHRDAWLGHLWDIASLPEDDPDLPRGCVPYLPCPVATLLDTIRIANVGRDDVFVDIGAGSGCTLALVHLLTHARGIGIEIQPGLVRAARARAVQLGLGGVQFIQGDAQSTVPAGDVYFLYCPFGGERLERVLASLERIARTRPIRVACVQLPDLERPWLEPIPSDAVEVNVYRSRG